MNKLQELELEDLAELGIEELEEEKVKRDFRINNLDEANWAFRKLKAIDEKIAEVTALADAEIKRINDWKDQEIKSFDRSINFFNFLLEQYYREQRELDPKFKLSTPYGKVSSRKQQPKWEYDEKQLLPYLEHYSPELIRIKKEVNKVDFKNSVNEGKGFVLIGDGKIAHAGTGEILEGITVTEQPDSITIKVVD